MIFQREGSGPLPPQNMTKLGKRGLAAWLLSYSCCCVAQCLYYKSLLVYFCYFYLWNSFQTCIFETLPRLLEMKDTPEKKIDTSLSTIYIVSDYGHTMWDFTGAINKVMTTTRRSHGGSPVAIDRLTS